MGSFLKNKNRNQNVVPRISKQQQKLQQMPPTSRKVEPPRQPKLAAKPVTL